MEVKFLIGCLVLFYRGIRVGASCYFQQELQGEYVMQSSLNGSRVQYATMTINATSIRIWGHCHKIIGDNYILRLSHGETNCIRCFHLKLRSPNILEMVTGANALSKCHINEEEAETSCPNEDNFKSKNITKILLFKTKDVHETSTRRRYCPLDGKYSVMYKSKTNNGSRKIECTDVDSTIDSCPLGSRLNIRLKGCNGNKIIHDFEFECLGNWHGRKGENVVIFTDSRQQKPKYRCAVYEKDKETDRIFMALSNDSTCTTDLDNATSGFETFLLVPNQTPSWPADVISGTCIFPEWMQGTWEHIQVNEDTLVYHDHVSFKTYTIKCAGFQEMKSKYLIFSRSQCNEEQYNCMWIHKRTNNILEFQIGTKSSGTNNIFNLCHDVNFLTSSWITQGRITAAASPKIFPGMCPIYGEYTGIIPDSNSTLCTFLRSDCTAEIMYYQVSSCLTGELYEQREYKCLGHWSEGELLYTYTKRMDAAAGTYECFVGSITPSKEIFIKEAGSFCQRNINPVKDGMQLIKNQLYSCVNKDPSIMNFTKENYKHTDKTTTTIPGTSRTAVTSTVVTRSTRRPWNFGNDNNHNGKTAAPNGTPLLKCILFLYIYAISIIFIL